jgi:hypothetical protein
LYGTGKETERAYFYQQGGYEHDESPTVDFNNSLLVHRDAVINPDSSLQRQVQQRTRRRVAAIRFECLYGTGKETERAYFYQQGGYEHDESPTVDFNNSS